jgi:hypothetical protein
MAKTIEKLDVFTRLEKAKSIREAAEKQAKEIESGILNELKDQRQSLMEQVKMIEGEIERISGKPVPTGETRKRIDTEPIILEIVREHGKVSCAAIETHPKMIARYAEFGREVSPQAAKLKSLIKENKLKKTGERKQAVYSLP